MNHPVEDAASHVVSHINKTGIAVSWAGLTDVLISGRCKV